jgi:hypothetical protein
MTALDEDYNRSDHEILLNQLSNYLGDRVDGFMIICDSTNNLSDDIDNNRLKVDLMIQPLYGFPWVELNFVFEPVDYLSITRQIALGCSINQENLEE